MKYTKDRTQILRYPSDLSRVWTDIDCPICVRIYSPNVIKTSQNGICWISPARVLFIPVKRALYLFHFCSFRILKLDLLQLQRSSWGWPWTVTKGAFVLFGAQTICVRKIQNAKINIYVLRKIRYKNVSFRKLAHYTLQHISFRKTWSYIDHCIYKTHQETIFHLNDKSPGTNRILFCLFMLCLFFCFCCCVFLFKVSLMRSYIFFFFSSIRSS